MRTRLSIAAIVAVVLAVAGVALASADSSGGSSNDRSVRVINLFTLTVQEEFIDLGAPGPAPSLGDQFVFSEDVSRR